MSRDEERALYLVLLLMVCPFLVATVFRLRRSERALRELRSRIGCLVPPWRRRDPEWDDAHW